MYGSKRINEWIRDYKPSTEIVVNNADSYTQFTQAIYFKNRFGFLPPPTRPVPMTELKWCIGAGNEYVHSANIDKHVADFCAKIGDNYKANTAGEWAEEYAVGTPSHHQMKLKWHNKALLSPEAVEAQCNAAIPTMIHSCDTSSHWKHGGGFDVSDGDTEVYSYTLTPLWTRPPPPAEDSVPGRCEVHYKFLFDSFVVNGGGWADDDFGSDHFVKNVKRCGALTSWKFEYFTDPGKDGFEWEASGRLPIGKMWSCIRSAVRDSGGPDVACTGS
jgi:hypothetical protein